MVVKNCSECSHGRRDWWDKKKKKRCAFYCLKFDKETDLLTAMNCLDWDGKGTYQ